MTQSKRRVNTVIFIFLTILALLFFVPIAFVVLNSFKSKLFISDNPFSLPVGELFVGFQNYIDGIEKTNFISAFGYSLFITVTSVVTIIIFTSMTAWYITRVKSKFTNFCYYAFIFAMVVPFQMIMFTMSKWADMLSLNNPLGIVVLYLGFGSSMSVFMFSGFVKSIPLEIEEAGRIDGASPLGIFAKIVFPIMKPITVTIGVLNAMFIWNDYLLPYLVIGLSTKYKTIPVVVQYLKGTYGNVDYGAFMALLVLSIIPIVIFYGICQKHIINGVISGAVKG